MTLDPVILNRLHFAITIGFHILFPVLTIGLSVFLVLAEGLWLKTGNEIYYRHCRFWGRLFLLNFGIGIVTGIVMEFQFGTNWALFSRFAGGFFGNILGYEAAITFAAEAAFFALMMFGWGNLSPRAHFFSTCMVSLMAVLSAFWIVDANSWMQAPRGIEILNGKMEIVNYSAALFNPFFLVSFMHKLFACLQIALLVVAGISAWYILKNRHADFFFKTFKISFFAGIVIASVQILLGDASGLVVYRLQPEKGAAIESRWETNLPGKSAAWALIAWPDPKNARNKFSIEIPGLLSLLATHSFTGTVHGLRDYPPAERPPILMTFYPFRLMVALGFFFFFLAVFTLWRFYKARFLLDAFARNRRLLWVWVATIPLGYVAMEAGWMVREIGRQPWSIYRIFKTANGISPVSGHLVLGSLISYCVIYALLFALFITFCRKIIREGPDFNSPLPRILNK